MLLINRKPLEDRKYKLNLTGLFKKKKKGDEEDEDGAIEKQTNHGKPSTQAASEPQRIELEASHNNDTTASNDISAFNNGTSNIIPDISDISPGTRIPLIKTDPIEDVPKPVMKHIKHDYIFNYDHDMALHSNYTHQHFEGAYSSVTSECISLQNSEMTCDSSHTHIPVSLNAVLSDESEKFVKDPHPREEYSDCDSDTESDVNFDPHCEESAGDYRYGGYHPVHKGETYFSSSNPHRSYVIMRKLGWGHFSTVWLARVRDSGVDSDSYVAIKFVKSNKNYLETAQDEIRILKALQNPLENAHHLTPRHRAYFKAVAANAHPGYAHVMKLLDEFDITGPHGHHICMVFEVLGENVLSLICRYKQFHSSLNYELKEREKKGSSSVSSKTPPKSIFKGTKNTDPRTSSLKFYKWDSHSLKKSTKSMLSLGMSKEKDIESTSPTCAVSPISGSASISSGDSFDGKKLGELNSESLLRVIQKSKTCGGIPLNLVRTIVRQMLMAMDYVHHCGVIHTDLKPENVLVDIKNISALVNSLERRDCLKPKSPASIPPLSRNESIASTCSYKRSKNSVCSKYDTPIRTSKPLPCSSLNGDVLLDDNDSQPGISVKIADLGNATFSHVHFTNQIQTRQYRSPEIILRYKSWGASTDMWSLGCIIFELITGDFLFDPYDGKDFDKDEDHLAQIIELLGEFPSDEYLIDCTHTARYFKLNPHTNEVVLKNIGNLKFWSLRNVLVEKYKFDTDDIHVDMITDLISKCLRFDLEERFDCKSLLQHPWLRDDTDLNDRKGIMDYMANMVSGGEDVPGFTGTWGDDEEEY